MSLSIYLSQGFDLTERVGHKNQYRIRCSQCEAVAINGVACHERGCPNATHECKGCNERIPMNQRYCQECVS